MNAVSNLKLQELIDKATLPGRRKGPPAPLVVTRNLTPEDILKAASTEVGEPGKVVSLKNTKNSHHQVARLLAAKEEIVTISAITGYSPARVHQLKADPLFQELLSHYERVEAELYKDARADMHARLSAIGFDSIETLHERLLENPDGFTNKELLAIVEATADRTGYGKTSTLNANVTFGLDAGVLTRIREGATQGAAREIAPEDREALLSLACAAAEVHPPAEEAAWVEGEGTLIREESIEGAND